MKIWARTIGHMAISESQVPQWWRICLLVQETQEIWVQSLDQEDPLQKEMATHSSTFAWEIPWTEEPTRLLWAWIFLARILDWVAISFSKGTSQPRKPHYIQSLCLFRLYVALRVSHTFPCIWCFWKFWGLIRHITGCPPLGISLIFSLWLDHSYVFGGGKSPR